MGNSKLFFPTKRRILVEDSEHRSGPPQLRLEADRFDVRLLPVIGEEQHHREEVSNVYKSSFQFLESSRHLWQQV